MESATTKRDVLTTIRCLFSPLGLISPTTIKTKIFLERLWWKGKQWDDKIDDSLKERWKNIVSKLLGLRHIHVPRYVENLRSEICCFCDASGKASATESAYEFSKIEHWQFTWYLQNQELHQRNITSGIPVIIMFSLNLFLHESKEQN